VRCLRYFVTICPGCRMQFRVAFLVGSFIKSSGE
jgi:hypothetical protein